MKYAQITSGANPKIKEILEIKNKRSKYRSTAFTIEGPNLIEMALASGHQIKEVFFTNAFSSKKDGQKVLREIAKKTDAIFEVTEQIMYKLADTETPQGIIATASYPQKNLEDIKFKAVPLIAIIDGIQEPGNLGTIIRTADAAGADAVIILKGACDPFMPKTLRATAGSIFNIPIIYTGTDKLLGWLKSNGIMFIATALDSGKSIFDSDLKNPIAFVFGNETHGVSSEIKRKADLTLKIPIFGKAESLNVSASAAVCLYEVVRQRL